MNEHIYPLTFEPVFRDYIWGGRHLETLFGRLLPPGIIAESWDISGHPSSPTKADRGFWKGQTLIDILHALGEELVGRNSRAMLARDRFPLLIKLLDANQKLSVQVHPDDAYAAVHEKGELGKTEMWYVLHAEPGTEIIYGVAPGVTRESFRRAIEDSAFETQLHHLSIRAGDCIFVGAGTIHALLEGAVVAEIQQNSDTTYRVYDWGRLGDDGKPRPLHLDKALDVINFDLVAPDKAIPVLLESGAGWRREALVDAPQFSVERIELEEGVSYHGRCDGATFEIWGCVAGRSVVQWEGEPVALEAVRFALLPAVLGDYTLVAEHVSTLLRAYVKG